jgi:type I restriction enzyme M protein
MASLQQQLFPLEKLETLRYRNRKNHNQYFTPEIAVEKALEFVPMTNVTNIIDPAVGDGIFLRVASNKWNNAKLFGIDIDSSVTQNLERMKLPNSFHFMNDSLSEETWETPKIKKIISNGGFDLVVGNPPFSSWFQRIKEPKVLANYKLARRNGKLMRSQAIEVLFLELFIRLAKNGSYIIIILPDGILSNPQYKYVREFILKETEVKHIISLPRNIFRDTSAKTSILILEKKRNNSIGYLVYLYEFQKTEIFNNIIEVRSNDLINRMDYYYYYSLEHSSLNELMNNEVEFVALKNFVVYCKTGKTLYGRERKFSDEGLRFLHATNITEIGIDYKKDEKFIAPSSKMNFPNAYARVEDILFVRVGVGCAGRVAIVDAKENEGVATDYIHIFKVKKINPYFLVVYLKTKFGKDSINLLKHGVGTVSINKTDLLSTPIPVVSRELQKEIGDRYKEILREYRFNIFNGKDLSIYKIMTKNLIINLQKILQEVSR